MHYLVALIAFCCLAACAPIDEERSGSFELEEEDVALTAETGRHAAFEREVIEYVNDWRSETVLCGDEPFGPSPAVASDAALRRAARGHSRDLRHRNVIAHESADGSRFWDRAVEFDGVPRGEAVAGGHPTPEAVVDAWIDSPGHCVVLLLPEATHVGVGYDFDGATRYGHFWTLVVGTR